VEAASTPAPGTVDCFSPMAVPLALAENHSEMTLVLPGITTPPPSPATIITITAQGKVMARGIRSRQSPIEDLARGNHLPYPEPVDERIRRPAAETTIR